MACQHPRARGQLEDFAAHSCSSLEWDFYGGYKANFPGSDDWNYDLGALYYYYPGRKTIPPRTRNLSKAN
jgi:hypothetical protein